MVNVRFIVRVLCMPLCDAIYTLSHKMIPDMYSYNSHVRHWISVIFHTNVS